MNKHILVFDSGLGGTTILEEIHQRLPDFDYSYAMDNEAFPYGNKTNEFLQQRISTLFNKLIALSQPDLIVIACNTASTLILDQLRSEFDIPFVGVVPAIKPAATRSLSKVICLLATQATVERDYIKQLNEAHAEHCEVIHFGTQQLVEIAESKILGKSINLALLHEELTRLSNHPRASQIDTFVLGCTHFPAIKAEISEFWPYQAEWIDSGEAIARRVEELSRQLPNAQRKAHPTLFLSKNIDLYSLGYKFQTFGIIKSQVINME